MRARLFLALILLILAAGCAQGYYETPTAPQPEARRFYTNPYTNPETEREYRQRIWWENYESEWPRFHHRWR